MSDEETIEQQEVDEPEVEQESPEPKTAEEDVTAESEQQTSQEEPVETEPIDALAPAEFQNFDGQNPIDIGGAREDINLDVILDVPVTLSMEIGRTRINIRNLLQLNQGSVVELDRLAGEPMDVTVNGTLIAHGEVVVVNDKFGIRLTDVISPAERVRKLQ